ncbi:MAG TPA: hypothetical protein VHV78_10565 [Gemmatimonadaceae bacterium]|jgi:hypothetical protein|nr:hypothetical protein [Gemmatimonadaceae bacterium]
MPPRIAKLAGLGAFAACAAFLALFAYVAYLCMPAPTGGIMMSSSVVAWIALGLVTVALIAVHVVFGRQLVYIGNGGGPRSV